MQRLINEAKSQIVDSSGKCRALYYHLKGEKGLLLYIRPMAPTDLAELKKGKIAKSPSLEEAQKFCEKMELTITANVVRQDKTIGLRVKGDLSWFLEESYIPIEETTKVIKGIHFEKSGSDPLLAPGISWPLTDMRLKRRTVSVLKAYVLWTYSRSLQGLGSWKKRDSFSVIDYPESVYMIKLQDLGSRLYLEGNDAIYAEGSDPSSRKIKVTSEEMITKLIKWLKVQNIREPDMVRLYWEKTTIPDLFKTISDFKQEEKQLVFVNKNGLLSWIRNQESKSRKGISSYSETQKMEVEDAIILETPEPYFYFLGKTLVIIQNVKGGKLEIAEAVSWHWHTHKINQGYSPILGETPSSYKAQLIDYTNPPSKITGPIISKERSRNKDYYFSILPV